MRAGLAHVARQCVSRRQPGPAAQKPRIERSRAPATLDRLRVTAELHHGVALEREPERPVGVARAQPHRIADVLQPFRGPPHLGQGVTEVGMGPGAARIELDGSLERFERAFEVSTRAVDESHIVVGAAMRRLTLEDLVEDRGRPFEVAAAVVIEVLHAHGDVESAQPDLRRNVVRVTLQCLLVIGRGLLERLRARSRKGCPHGGAPAVDERLGVIIRCTSLSLGGNHLEPQLAGKPADDLVLDAMPVGAVPLDPARPDREPGRRIDQLDVDPQLAAVQAQAAFQDVADLELFADGGDIDRLPPVAARGLTRDYAQPRDSREDVDQIVRHHVGEQLRRPGGVAVGLER